MFEAGEGFAEFAAGAEGGDADSGSTPAGEGANLGDGFFLKVEHADDHLLAWLEGGEEFVEELPAELVAAFAGSDFRGAEVVLEKGCFFRAEVAVGNEAAGPLTAEAVVAGVEGDARHPVLERLAAGELVEAGEDFHENFLTEVLLRFGAGEVVADDGDDEWIELVDELPGKRFVAPSDCIEEFGADCRVSVIHQGRANGAIPKLQTPRGRWRYRNVEKLREIL